MKEVLILEDKSETRKVLASLVKEVHSDAVIYEAADEKTAYDIAMKRTIDLFLVDIILHPQQHDDVSGGEFAQNIRKVDKYLFTPILTFLLSETSVTGPFPVPFHSELPLELFALLFQNQTVFR